MTTTQTSASCAKSKWLDEQSLCHYWANRPVLKQINLPLKMQIGGLVTAHSCGAVSGVNYWNQIVLVLCSVALTCFFNLCAVFSLPKFKCDECEKVFYTKSNFTGMYNRIPNQISSLYHWADCVVMVLFVVAKLLIKFAAESLWLKCKIGIAQYMHCPSTHNL